MSTPPDLSNILDRRAQVEAFQRKHRIGLLTLVFTDIVGSTKLKQSLGDAEGFDRIQVHHDVVREVLKLHPEGEEISTAGDSFFLVFAKPSEAVKFALLLQARLRELAQTSAAAVFDRIGIHIGEVIIDERAGGPKPKDLYGIQVDICARVMSAGDGDQILMTRSTFDNARQVLKGKRVDGLRDLVWLNHGPYALQGVDEPLDLCEVGEEGLARLRPPEDSEKVRRFVSAAAAVGTPASNAGGTPQVRRVPVGRWVAGAGMFAAVVVVAVVLRSRESGAPSNGGSTATTGPTPALPANTVVQRIGFEAAEGYKVDQPLSGQNGWSRGKWASQLESGGEGVGAGLFGGSGQQAFLGGVAGATVPAVHASLSRLLVYNPSPGREVAEIGWRQHISASDNAVGNLFEWLFYNQSGQLLCGVIFDNSRRVIGRRFADNSIAFTPLAFADGEVIDVKVKIDFGRNRWSASIGGNALEPVVIAPQNRIPNLGGMAVTWRSVAAHARTTGGAVAGDNRLAFDDIVLTASQE